MKIPQQSTLTYELKKKIYKIVKNLPAISYTPRANGEIDYYGASDCIARQLGLKGPLKGRSTWRHGWMWRDPVYPEDVIVVDSNDRTLNNLLHTEREVQFVKKFGYSNAKAVGAPILYAEHRNMERIKDSVLVFPPHSTAGSTFNAKGIDLPYINFINDLQERFSLVAFSVGAQDVINGNWIQALEHAKIPWITGAWMFDRNALPRMIRILRSFEYVTSNVPGSHIAYAAYCGCKVSYYGMNEECKKSDVLRHPFYEENPHVRERLASMDLEDEFRRKYPYLCVRPWEAKELTERGKEMLGVRHKRQPEEIAHLFGWNIRQISPGRWKPLDEFDYLTNGEVLGKAIAKSRVDQHNEAFKLTNILKRRHVRLKDMEVIRARYFISIDNTHGAREALKEELRHFPDNAQAVSMLQELGGDMLPPHVAKNEDEKEFVEFYNRIRPFTRLNIRRAKSLYELAVRVCMENVPGNFVECGVAAGGSTMLLALVVQKYSTIPRKVFAFDTFTGMPDPSEADTANGVPADETGWGTGTCAAPEEFVKTQCRRLGVGGIVETRKGLFEDTLPVHRREVGVIGLLHMDADWYSSTMTILRNLFDQLDGRALIQIDDYGAWDGCRKAILDYAAQHDLLFRVHEIDNTGVWCTKPTQVFRKTAGNFGPPGNDAFLNPKMIPEFADLYLVRKGILERIEQVIPHFSGVLLDVGCGQMPYREHILSKNPNITRYIGLDFAQGKYADLRQPDLIWDGTVIPLEDKSVDCAMATEVLEHCFNPLIVLREIKRVLKPEGLFFFTTPFLWPLHDTPHDHYRYTPFAMQHLLQEAGFDDIHIEALGGWNAALAQMIGLWLRRAPMAAEARGQLTKDLFPFFSELVRTDVIPTDFSRDSMISGLAGTARSAGPGVQQRSNANSPRVIVVTDQFPVLSQTFIVDQMTGLIDYGLALEHWSLQRMDEPVVHENVRKYGLLDATRYISLPSDSLRADPKRWTDQFLLANGLSSLDDAAAIQIHFGPNFNKLAPLFAVYPDLFVLVSFHGYDGSATFKVKGADVYAGLFARANQITTPSQFMKNTLIQYGCPSDKIVVHHYGKDTATFAPAPRQESCSVRLLSVARFVEKKGLEYSLRAFAKAQTALDAQYRIVGYGPLEPELATLVRDLNMADKVVFLGQLTNEAVRQEMATADIFALTSVTASNGDQEGVPVSLIEAQALGLPVVSSWHAGIPELVVHGETGFLAEERNVDEIAGFLRVLIKNSAIRNAFSVNARERVLREFDLAKLNAILAGRLLRSSAGRDQGARSARQKADSAGKPGGEPHSGSVYCPICRKSYDQFRPFGKPPRPNALCPNCTSLERHRAIWVFLERHTDFFSSPRLRLLHFAPEACLEPRFRHLMGTRYVTADLLNPRADVQADITSLQFPDASFDVVLCSHVLEHVPDDNKAMCELHRVLDTDGIAIVLVPLRGAVTVEDLSITDPEERTRRYGQSDHIRYYGMDIVDRLQAAGFAVQCINTAAICTPRDFAGMRFSSEQIFLCRKQAKAKTTYTDGGVMERKVAESPHVTALHGQGGMLATDPPRRQRPTAPQARHDP